MIEVSEKRFDEQIASRDAEIATLREQVKMLRKLLLRYRTEVKPGFQPHMICLEVDEALTATEQP